jgi:hypothetical protein
MSIKKVSWILFGAITLGAVVLFNYWASYQLLSTLAYSGIVAALLGLANLAFPFRFMGVLRRRAGALVLAGGVALAFAALSWPASMIRVVQHKSLLDDIVPEYQFFEVHSARIHARPEQVMQALRQSTFADMTSLATLLKIRGAAARVPHGDTSAFLQNRRIIDSFSESGYLSGGNDHEIVICGAVDMRAMRRPDVRTLQACGEYRDKGGVKTVFGFIVEDLGGGWSTLTTETRVVALDDSTSKGAARYWRLIVPGSGLLRLQWLDGIKRRAENGPISG